MNFNNNNQAENAIVILGQGRRVMTTHHQNIGIRGSSRKNNEFLDIKENSKNSGEST
jgi:hypothetical protein